jgi:hypothetical protein
MSNELLFVTVAVGAVIALWLARFAILHDPAGAIRQRVGRVVHEADPDVRARICLEELQRPAGSMRRADDPAVR